MTDWNIEYWHSSSTKKDLSIENVLNNLTTEQVKSVAKELKLLELCGNNLKLPHSKPLGQGLFELRERKFGFRIYYTFSKHKIILLLHAGNKTNQQKDIKIARERLVEFFKEMQRDAL